MLFSVLPLATRDGFQGTVCTLGHQARSDKGIVGICGGEGRGRKDHCVGIGGRNGTLL